jgi:hypothetical protein
MGDWVACNQLTFLPLLALSTAHYVIPGAAIRVRLTSADPVQRRLEFQRVA